MKFDDYEDEIELDDDLQEQFGNDISSIASKHIKNSNKKNHKDLKFKKDGYYDRNNK